MDIVFNLPEFIQGEVPPVTIKVLKSRNTNGAEFLPIDWSHVTISMVEDPVYPDAIYNGTRELVLI